MTDTSISDATVCANGFGTTAKEVSEVVVIIGGKVEDKLSTSAIGRVVMEGLMFAVCFPISGNVLGCFVVSGTSISESANGLGKFSGQLPVHLVVCVVLLESFKDVFSMVIA